MRDHSARASNRAPAPQKHTGTGVLPNDELVNMNGPNAPGLGIKLGGCIHSERYYIASSKWLDDREHFISKKQNNNTSVEGTRPPKGAMLLRDIYKFTKPSLDADKHVMLV